MRTQTAKAAEVLPKGAHSQACSGFCHVHVGECLACGGKIIWTAKPNPSYSSEYTNPQNRVVETGCSCEKCGEYSLSELHRTKIQEHTDRHHPVQTDSHA